MAYMIILGFIVANIIMLPLSMFYCNFLATAVLRLKREILSGIVLVLCVTGAFAVSNNIFNIYIMIFFGFIGYTFNKYKIPQSPLILASILGSMMENNWTQSMVFCGRLPVVFVTRPLEAALLILSIIFIGMPLVKRFKAAKRQLNFKSYGESFHRLGGAFPFDWIRRTVSGGEVRVKINQMEYFAQVCRLGTITRAAKGASCFPAQLTAAIHEMEKELGGQPVLRRNNKLYLTGRNFVLDRVVDILKDVEQLDQDLKGFVGTKTHPAWGSAADRSLSAAAAVWKVQENEPGGQIRDSGEQGDGHCAVSAGGPAGHGHRIRGYIKQWDVSWTPLYQSDSVSAWRQGHPQSSLDSIT